MTPGGCGHDADVGVVARGEEAKRGAHALGDVGRGRERDAGTVAGVHVERLHDAVVAPVREQGAVAIEATALRPAVPVVARGDLAEKARGFRALRGFVRDVPSEEERAVPAARVGGHRDGQPTDRGPEVKVEAEIVIGAGVVAQVRLLVAVHRVAYGHRVAAVCSLVEGGDETPRASSPLRALR